MITKRKDPDVLDTSKSLLEPPVYPSTENTRPHLAPKDDPDLLRGTKVNNDEFEGEIDDNVLGRLGEDEEDEW